MPERTTLFINASGSTTVNLLRSLSNFLAKKGALTPGYIGYGNDNEHAPSKTDKTLGHEFDNTYGYARTPIYNIDVRINDANEAEVTFIFVDSSETKYQGNEPEPTGHYSAIKEIGIFESAEIGAADCVARITFEDSEKVEKKATNSLEIEWKIKLSCS